MFVYHIGHPPRPSAGDHLMRPCFAVFVFVIGSHFVHADWNQFRGPTGEGHAKAKNLPTEFGPDKNVAWKTAIPGTAWSSPVIVAGKVYLTTAVPQSDEPMANFSLRTLCLNADTGSILWNEETFKETEADRTKVHKKNSHASPTPFVEGDRLYVHFGHMGTACLNAATGKPIWTQRIKYTPVHGNGGSAMPYKNLLLFSIDGIEMQKLVALDKATGKVKWETPRKATPKSPFSFSTPTPITVNGKDQIISAGSDVVLGVDPATGKEIWRARYPGGYSLIPKPVYAHGLVYVCTGYNKPNLMAIKPDGTGDVTEKKVDWTVKTNVPHSASILVIGDDIYMVADKGILSCLNAITGEERWNERVSGNYSASPIYADGHIYLFSEEGAATVFKPGNTYDPIAVNKFDERILASPAVDGDALYVRTAANLYKFVKK
jgi:outer membrane protein assembly factor BamB